MHCANWRRQQRDELAEALKECIESNERWGLTLRRRNAVEAAYAALAKVKK